MIPRPVAAIILAAGASRRLGHPKQLVQLNGETLLDGAVRIAREAGCTPVLVVLGSEAALIESHCKLDEAHVVLNKGWPEGMATSIHAALNAMPAHISGAILMVCDQPAVTSHHLRALAATGQATASYYAGRHGVPAYLPTAVFPLLAQLTGDAGARELLRTTPAIPLPFGELDIDTPADLDFARSLPDAHP